MNGFAKVNGHALSKLGVGKIIDVDDGLATISWFDSPVTENFIESIELEYLKPVLLERQTRVYWLDLKENTWRVGRVLDADDSRALIRFANFVDIALNLVEVEVRWDRAIEEPSAFLSAQINESPQFSEARAAFKGSMIRQRAACTGMSALISSIIDLEQHQYEVVKRVLQDPIQRYLLADEVGLGKTIEAGVLIRQFVLDDPRGHNILVICPRTLVVQWRRELRKRFLLEHFIDDSVNVLAMDAEPNELLEAITKAQMLVIDEAHHLSQDPSLYSKLREAVISVPRLLLLSATPVLHNERGFLEMLHLLDPRVYKLEDEDSFRERIQNRQILAECVAGLLPENLFMIEEFIDLLETRFPKDSLLKQHTKNLSEIVLDLPDKSDPDYCEALRVLRAHLTETYRLDRRILRNRRRDLPFLTPVRDGLVRVEYSSSAETDLIQAIENWRNSIEVFMYSSSDEVTDSKAKFLSEIMEAYFSDAGLITRLVQARIEDTSVHQEDDSELTALRGIIDAADKLIHENQRLNTLVSLVEVILSENKKVVIFCSSADMANSIRAALESELKSPVDRHTQHQDLDDDDFTQAWELFLTEESHNVLICDALSEEGLNLQGGSKVIIHYDLPLDPNRIEQRIGRVDRYGSGDAIKSYAFSCKDDPYINVWLNYLENGLKLFSRSVASLQYVVDEQINNLRKTVFTDGIDAFNWLQEQTSGSDGVAEKELKRIDEQDALDSLTIDDESELFEALTDVDSDWCSISNALQEWVVEILNTGVESLKTPGNNVQFGFDCFRLAFSYKHHGRESLIPLKKILIDLLQILDVDAPGANSKLLKTVWYTCRRTTAIGESSPEEGVRLVRWGDEFVDSIDALTDLDDRGRVAAVWRQNSNYKPHTNCPADLYLRFDFIVEADVESVLNGFENFSKSELHPALSRRGDMVFPPFYKRVWLDEQMSIVDNHELIMMLEAPYQKVANETGYKDWNLNSERWQLLRAKNLSVMEVWNEWVAEARVAAQAILIDETDLIQTCELAVRKAAINDQIMFSQLESRLEYSEGGASDNLMSIIQTERKIAEALHKSVQSPKITLSTVTALFISSEPFTEI
ncbi:protein DpdE [Methylophaga pinxianii]|uniref:protein DpdE n=1 Tax=Methylophaga pinxianii TaxID=2881052 RepID=UPI001CF3FE58|nr:protein DpdE [Methylophaga pinxianii]MCB2426418.1 hypothetical protein [Methylophaga pinxianii]UPH44989.1 SNF2-related protein [Methylophaga pinxianii]